MELSILDTIGLPEGSLLSVRSGPTRRQSPLPCSAPFRLPGGPWPLRIDVLATLGKSNAAASLSKLDGEGRCVVPLESPDGRKMSVTLQVFDPKANTRPKPEAGTVGHPQARKRDAEAEARAYLDRHRLHEFMHALFELLLKERPEDPYAFIANKFNEAAAMEPRNAPSDIRFDKHDKVSRSLVSTAPTSAPTVKSDADSLLGLAQGQVEIVVRNLRGRTLTRMGARLDEKVSAIKARLESSLGVPVASQHLLWWAETLPNNTTLEEHGVPATGATVHLAVGARDPRAKLALSGSSDGGIRLWDMRDGELIRDFNTGGSNAILAMAVHWESMRAVTGAFNGRLQLWNLATGECQLDLQAHNEEINVVEVDWSTMRVLSGAAAQPGRHAAEAKLWDLETGKCTVTLEASSTVYTLAADWTKNKACGGLRSGMVRLWDLSTGAKLRDFGGAVAAAQASNSTVSAVAIDCVNYRAVSGLEDGHLIYWHFGKVEEDSSQGAASSSSTAPAETQKATPKPKALLAHYCAIRAIQANWKPEGSQALCGSDDGSLSLWRVDTSECLARFARHVGYVWTLYADWSRGRALSGAFDGCFKLWDLRNGDCLRTVQSHCRPVRSICGGSS